MFSKQMGLIFVGSILIMELLLKSEVINTYAAEVFQTSFHSVKAGIAHAISSPKWRKILITFMKKYTSLKCYF